MELRQYLAVIRKWLWLIVLGTLLCGGTAYLAATWPPSTAPPPPCSSIRPATPPPPTIPPSWPASAWPKPTPNDWPNDPSWKRWPLG